MLRLPMEVKDFPLQFFLKPRLVEFSRSLIVLFLSLIKQALFLQYRFAVSQFPQICKVFIWKLINCDRFLNVIITLLL